MLFSIGISWCDGRFVPRRAQTMRHGANQLLRQMRWKGVVGFGICVVTVLILVISVQRSAAQTSSPPIQDTNPKSLIKSVDRSLTSTGKKDGQTAKRKPHRLIRKSQSALTGTLQPTPLEAPKLTSSTALSTSPLSDTTAQSKDTLGSSKVGTAAAPATSSLTLMSTATATTSTTVSPNTTVPRNSLLGSTALAGATSSNSSTGATSSAAGRSMSRLTAEMPGLTQLVSPTSSSSSPPAPVPPAIGASPTSFSFAATQGGANPASQTLSLSNTGGGTLSWSASDNATWLTVSPGSGTGNGTVTLTATTGMLTTGSYSGVITLAATGATSVTVPVTFTVAAAPVPPAIGASPTSFSFTATQGGANPASQTLSLSNTGGGTLSWSASDNAAWLTVSPASGTGNGTVSLSVTTGTLTTGSYSGVITLAATGATPVTVPITFTVSAAPVPPAIGASPTSFSFAATQGGTNPAA